MSEVEPVPAEFLIEVERARAAGVRSDLRLYAYESRRMPWAAAGLRAATRAQLDLGAFSDAKETLAWLLEVQPADSESDRVAPSLQRRTRRRPERYAASDGRCSSRGTWWMRPADASRVFRQREAAEAEARQMIVEALQREGEQEAARDGGDRGRRLRRGHPVP